MAGGLGIHAIILLSLIRVSPRNPRPILFKGIHYESPRRYTPGFHHTGDPPGLRGL